MKMIAKAVKGQEFIYDRNSAHAVSERSAQLICDVLNERRWGLKDGQVWNVYECGWYEKEWTAAAYQSFVRRNGGLCEKVSRR